MARCSLKNLSLFRSVSIQYCRWRGMSGAWRHMYSFSFNLMFFSHNYSSWLISKNYRTNVCVLVARTSKSAEPFQGWSHELGLYSIYSTLGGKTDKLDEAVNRELNVTRSWNFVQTVDLAWFILQMIFKQICIFYAFKAPLLENR